MCQKSKQIDYIMESRVVTNYAMTLLVCMLVRISTSSEIKGRKKTGAGIKVLKITFHYYKNSHLLK